MGQSDCDTPVEQELLRHDGTLIDLDMCEKLFFRL